MNATLTSWMRRSALGAVPIMPALFLTGCSTPAHSTVPLSLATGRPVVVRTGAHTATATLSATPEGRQFAAMLPLTVVLKDAWGQAKSGPLPRPLSVEAVRPVRRPAPGGIYVWPGTGAIAIYYDDLGQSVPDPGLVQIGVIDTGLDALADAGRRFTVSIERP